MNPFVLAKAAPYAIAAMIAFGLAWGIQSLRLTSAKQELVEFKQEQTRIIQEHNDAADKQRKESDLAYQAARKQLEAAMEAGDIFKRCVMAGRCSAPRNPVGLCKQSANPAGNGLSAPSRPDDPSPLELPAFTGDAAINDCAVTTLQLNHLQADIEAQPGY